MMTFRTSEGRRLQSEIAVLKAWRAARRDTRLAELADTSWVQPRHLAYAAALGFDATSINRFARLIEAQPIEAQ
jgi:hypothetical protein